MYLLRDATPQDGNIKAEVLQLQPSTSSSYRRSLSVARDQIENLQTLRAPSGTGRIRSNPRGSVRSGRRGSSILHLEATHGQELQGESAQPNKLPVVCHRGTINSVFRDPRNDSHVVSAGDDGQMKW